MPSTSPTNARLIALPRGRPEGPRILRVPVDLPGPTWHRGLLYVIAGRPIQWIAERWLEGDVFACPTAALPDPERPGVYISTRLIDWATDEVLPQVGLRRLGAALRHLEHLDEVRIGRGQPPTLRTPADLAQPRRSWHFGWSVYGHLVVLVGERWEARDSGDSLSPCFPDSQSPGTACTTRLLDATDGRVIPAASAEEFAAATEACLSPLRPALLAGPRPR